VEAVTRDTWDASQWADWTNSRLTHVLNRAATRVPFYREHWEQRRRRGDRSSWLDLANWPIVEKADVRERPEAFVADDCNPTYMFRERTSGSTGVPLKLWWSAAMVRGWYALSEARIRYWHGLSRKDRWAILGGQLVTPYRQQRPPFWVWNAGLRQLYLSAFHIAPDFVPYYLDALLRYRVKYLYGYSHSLHSLALEVLHSGRRDVKLAVVITNAEPLYDHQREVISEAFSCPVRETYGMAEAVVGASECEHGTLHLWPELGHLELLEGDAPARGLAGDLIATSLLNVDTPLIRYRTGDRARCAPDEFRCPCGRTLPVLEAVEGRSDEVLFTADGRAVGRFDGVFKFSNEIRQGQIIQEALDFVRIRYVPTPQFTEATGQELINRLRARLGPVRIRLEAEAELPREASGKFRVAVCRIPDREHRRSRPGI
jgi:phenylacetate-CoA ligase